MSEETGPWLRLNPNFLGVRHRHKAVDREWTGHVKPGLLGCGTKGVRLGRKARKSLKLRIKVNTRVGQGDMATSGANGLPP